MFRKNQIRRTPLQIEQCEYVFYINYLKPGMVAFDVGGNIGEISLLFSHFVGTNGYVHSFEAASKTFEKLKEILLLTNKRNIILNNYALSDKKGERELFVYPEEYSTWNTFANRPLEKYGIEIKPEKTTIVATETIDNYCENNSIKKIDLLKIDAEGSEVEVLLGAKKMFEKKAIGCCVFEFGQTIYDMGYKPDDLKSFFNNVGYRIKNIVPHSKILPHSSNNEAEFSIHYAIPR